MPTNTTSSSQLDDFYLFTMPCNDWRCNNVQCERGWHLMLWETNSSNINMFKSFCFLSLRACPPLLYYTPTVLTRLQYTKCSLMRGSYIFQINWLYIRKSKMKLLCYCIAVFPDFIAAAANVSSVIWKVKKKFRAWCCEKRLKTLSFWSTVDKLLDVNALVKVQHASLAVAV